MKDLSDRMHCFRKKLNDRIDAQIMGRCKEGTELTIQHLAQELEERANT